jgi:mono/diheme cytochrome c family protein
VKNDCLHRPSMDVERRQTASAAGPQQMALRGLAWILAIAGTTAVLAFGTSHAQAPGRQAAQRANAPAGNTENGKKVFADARCANCHGDQGQGGTGAIVGPKIAAPTMALAMFVDHVRTPKDPMPPYSVGQLSDAALTDVYAYLKSVNGAVPAIAPTSSNADNGRKLFVSAGCYECHGREAQGGDRTGPRLGPNPIPFTAFVKQCREPVSQMPPYTSKVLSDTDLSDIYAFLQGLPKPPDISSIPILH